MIDFGIKLEENSETMNYLVDNYSCAEFYGVEYLLQKKNAERQDIYDYLVENNSANQDFINQAG